MNIEALIFDLDGTLLDTIEDIAAANNKMLKMSNFPIHDTKKYIGLIGEGVEKMVSGSLPSDLKPDKDLLKKYVALYSSLYSTKIAVKSCIYKGIDLVLDYLKTKKIPVSVNTNKPHEQTISLYDKFFQKWNFNQVIGHMDGNPHKPNPAGALAISSELNVKPENTLFIGDSLIDILTARAAGMIPVAVGWGYGNKKELINSDYYSMVQTPEELLIFLKAQFG